MPTENQPSFSRSRRWKIGFDVVVRTLLVLAVLVMLNFIGAQFSHRFYLSSQTRVQLSSRTLSVLHSLTNQISVTLYYDKQDDFYPDIVGLLGEYALANPDISVKSVDYVDDAGAAEKVKQQYSQFFPSSGDKDLVIFDAGGNRVKVVSGEALVQYGATGMSKDKKLEFAPVAFNGEKLFSSVLLALENSKPLKAYFLEGDGEPALDDSGVMGYLKFASVLRGENYIDLEPLRLMGDDDVPMDCNLLIIAGPTTAMDPSEIQKISRYLAQGGRLFVLLNNFSIQHPTGLEDVLERYGVSIINDRVHDPVNHQSDYDVIVLNFSRHPVVNPLANEELEMVLPRPVGKMQNLPDDAPTVDALAFSGTDSVLVGEPGGSPRAYPLMVAVEQNPVAGVASPRGTMRMIVVGDSFFLDNNVIDAGANRDFLGYAVNWLLDRTTLLEGIGPRPVTEFRLLMTQAQQQDIRWILLFARPGGVLVLGWLVWLARRK
jgi:hypothetical protein